MANAMTSFLLETLKETVTEYINLKSGAGEEFKKLNNELRVLEAFLKDSAMMSEKKEVFREMERQIRELVYDVQDAIETCLAKKAAAETKNSFLQIVEKMSINVAKEVKSLRLDKVKPIVDEINKEFGKIEIGTQMNMEQSLSQPTPSVKVFNNVEESSLLDEPIKQEKVVDLEDKTTILNYLMELKEELGVMVPKEDFGVIFITGMPGLGKTTLARTIFHDAKVGKVFPLRIWVRVSQKFNSRAVFLDILKRLNPKQASDPSDGDLVRAVRECLAKQTFLLVMDDVWAVEDWKVIEEILPTDNRKGKVLVTSRERTLAGQDDRFNLKTHELQPLDSKKSWELLKLNVFGNHTGWPNKLEDVGEAIASKCGGSPLIIGVIAGILREKGLTPPLESEWLKLLKSVEAVLMTDKENTILKAVELSYQWLPHDLRMCFLYTGLFPDNDEIPASTLTQLWIAEGFIRPKKGMTTEETANKFLRDLVNKNLLMVGKMSLHHVKSCSVHDSIREFCKAKAAEENFFTIVKKPEEGVSKVQKFRRLCVHSEEFLSKAPKGQPVRSFLCFLKQSFNLDPKHISAFPVLRVMSCKSIKFEQFPKVTGLILLKHITLSIGNFNTLPEEISQLIYLQTLIVETSSHSIEVKANIWKMMELRCLKTKAAIKLDDKKWKGEAGEKLQTVSRLSPESCTPALSERACQLNILGIRGKLANLFDTFSLEKFSHLEELELVNDLVHGSASKSPLSPLPHSDRFPSHLQKLTLSNTYLLWHKHMPVLANINTLEVLKLKDNAFHGIRWDAEGNGFRNLQYLLVENLELVIWKASTTHFPSLRWLVLNKCRKLQKIPSEVAANLEKLDIASVRKSATESARKIEKILAESNHRNKFRAPFKLNEGHDCDL